jgi:hypothetical protein
MESGMGGIPAWTSEMSVSLPVAGAEGFYRAYLVPQQNPVPSNLIELFLAAATTLDGAVAA